MERAILKGNIARYRNLLESGQAKDRSVVVQLLAEAERELRELETVSTHDLARADSIFRAIAETALDEAIRLTRAHFGTIQVYDDVSRTLVILAQRNFRKPFLDHFAVVTVFDSTACARALVDKKAALIEDVDTDPTFAPHRQVAREAGFRAVISAPLIGPRGKLIGILSTHFSQPRQFAPGEVAALTHYATSVALGLDRRLTPDDEANGPSSPSQAVIGRHTTSTRRSPD
ncbi:MAG: GAF domain-containing protein [Rhizomicrobium sp.]